MEFRESEAEKIVRKRREQNRLAQRKNRMKKRAIALNIETQKAAQSTTLVPESLCSVVVDEIAFCSTKIASSITAPQTFTSILKPLSLQLSAKEFGEVVRLACDAFSVPYHFIIDARSLVDTSKSWTMFQTGAYDGASDVSQDIPASSWGNKQSHLFPTPIQLAIPHHPGIDITFPSSKLRDNMVLHLGKDYDVAEVCCDFLMGLTDQSGNQQPSFLIWGDDIYDKEAWEISQCLLDKWPLLFDDETIKRSNWWKSKRGVHPLHSSKFLQATGLA